MIENIAKLFVLIMIIVFLLSSIRLSKNEKLNSRKK